MSNDNPNMPLDEAGDVTVEDGAVLVDGPDGVAITLTPGAARVFGERLIEAAAKAGSSS